MINYLFNPGAAASTNFAANLFAASVASLSRERVNAELSAVVPTFAVPKIPVRVVCVSFPRQLRALETASLPETPGA